MLCVWVHGCDPGRVSDCSRLALYQLSLSSALSFSGICFVLIVFLSFLFLFCFVSMLSLELCVDVPLIFFLSGRPRTGWATTFITRYG